MVAAVSAVAASITNATLQLTILISLLLLLLHTNRTLMEAGQRTKIIGGLAGMKI
jgi:hypothetical protein